MNVKEEIIIGELQRTLEWIGKNPNMWVKVNELSPNESSPEEIIEAIDMFVKEKRYVPLILYLANEFVSYRGEQLIRRILVEVLLSQWNENTWNMAIKAMKETINEYIEENKKAARE